MMKSVTLIFALALFASGTSTAKMKALILDGQNNHVIWPKSTMMMKQYLEETGLFEVDINRMRYTWRGEKRESSWLPKAGLKMETSDLPNPKEDPDFTPAFDQYDVVVSNLGFKTANWPEATQRTFEDYVKNGGGFISVHAANNAWANWKEFNLMTGIGGWGGRKGNTPGQIYIYYNDAGELVRDAKPGRKVGAHGPSHEFPVTVRVADHPITKGMPEVWLHSKDECWALLRGPAENMTVLATAKDQTDKAPTDRHEPVLMVVDYGKGRVVNTVLGHDTEAFEGVGFITILVRSAEWAATGKVTTPIPTDFPTKEKSSGRRFELKN
ncbi:MAG: ThuA domain-containing protein [Verrucomicrobiota bacterium]